MAERFFWYDYGVDQSSKNPQKSFSKMEDLYKEMKRTINDDFSVTTQSVWKKPLKNWLARAYPSFDFLPFVKHSNYKFHHIYVVYQCKKNRDDKLFLMSMEMDRRIKGGTAGILVQYSEPKSLAFDEVDQGMGSGVRSKNESESSMEGMESHCTQMEKMEEEFANMQMGEQRYENDKLQVTRVESKCVDHNPFYHLDGKDIQSLLSNWNMPAIWKVTSNCQHFVHAVQDHFTKMESALKLKFPASSKDVSLTLEGLEQLKDMVTREFGDPFSSDIVTFIPRRENRLPIVLVHKGSVAQAQIEAYEDFELRQMLCDNLTNIFEECSWKDGMVYLSNLNNANIREAMSRSDMYATDETACKSIVDFWTHMYDGVMLSKKFGIIIIKILNYTKITGNIEEDSDDDETDKMQIIFESLLKVGLPPEKDVKVPISCVSIGVSNVKAADAKTCKTKGNRITVESRISFTDVVREAPQKTEERHSVTQRMSRSCSISDQGDIKIALKAGIEKSLKTIREKHSERNVPISEKQLEYFLGKLIVLQNLHNNRKLVDQKLCERIRKQEWIEGSTVWSINQKLCIDTFQNLLWSNPEKNKKVPEKEKKVPEERASYLLKGCPGSGKTMILMKYVEDYLTPNDKASNKKVLIVIPDRHAGLKSMFEEMVKHQSQTDGEVSMNGKITVAGSLLGKEIKYKEIGLVVLDEFNTLERKIYEVENKGLLNKLRNKHVVIATSDDNVQERHVSKAFKRKFREMLLTDGSYRNTGEVATLANIFQENVCIMGEEKIMDVTSKIVAQGMGSSRIEPVTDESSTREDFIKRCADIIEQQAVQKAGKILIFNLCHIYILKLIINQFHSNSIDDVSTDQGYAPRQNQSGRLSEDEFKGRLVFLTATEAQGSEYANVIGIADPASCYLPSFEAYKLGFSRCILHAVLILNQTEVVPLLEDGRPCIDVINVDNGWSFAEAIKDDDRFNSLPTAVVLSRKEVPNSAYPFVSSVGITKEDKEKVSNAKSVIHDGLGSYLLESANGQVVVCNGVKVYANTNREINKRLLNTKSIWEMKGSKHLAQATGREDGAEGSDEESDHNEGGGRLAYALPTIKP